MGKSPLCIAMQSRDRRQGYAHGIAINPVRAHATIPVLMKDSRWVGLHKSESTIKRVKLTVTSAVIGGSPRPARRVYVFFADMYR